MVNGGDEARIEKTVEEGLLRPVEGHPEAVIAFDVNRLFRS
jgi:hypothetical protein